MRNLIGYKWDSFSEIVWGWSIKVNLLGFVLINSVGFKDELGIGIYKIFEYRWWGWGLLN